MATRTTYYNLIKPSQTDPVDVRDLNTNFDNIDAIMHTNETNIDALDGRITTAESDIDDLQESTEHLSDGDTVYPYASEIEIEDALGIFAKDVKVKITAVQSGSGTPSPQNVRPISGWDECEIEVESGNFFSSSSMTNGKYVGSDGTLGDDSHFWASDYVGVDGGKTYTLSYYRTGNYGASIRGMRIAWYDANKTFIQRDGDVETDGTGTKVISVSAPNNAVYARYSCVDSDYGTSYRFSVLVDYTIQLGDTIYGGTLDVTTGVMTVDRKVIGENDFGTVPTSTSSGGLHWVDYEDNSVKRGGTAIANMILFDNTGAWESTTPVGQVSSSNKRVRVYGNFTSQAEFRTMFAGLQIVYELDTPITIQLTPQQIKLLEGYNLISANTGDISITTTDIKGAIGQADELIEANTQAIREIDSFNDSIFGTIENGTTASKTYAQGDYFVKDKKMCKALTSIAQGATFTLNTNYSAYTLAEILKSIEQS